MELADVTDSKSVGATRAGSSPATGTKLSLGALCVRTFLFLHLLEYNNEILGTKKALTFYS